ncbi:hypothetical protein GCM10007383_27340 [Arenibacter certesii]|uniref:Uncharacterized protein n=1 Tax=Arenibacter certesii TaxID=228955 RepID=A0A918J044_9FLAO|nr:hypothetical protein GCM10007383_27340 [Arenibacter certesii]
MDLVLNPQNGDPQDVIQDNKLLEREKHPLKMYIIQLGDAIIEADALALFDPRDTNEKFKKEITSNYKSIATKLKTVIKLDSMTENQVKALVRNYFNEGK